MRRTGFLCAAFAAVACIAAGGAAATPADPVPATPSCGGHLYAVSNLESGRGPGYYMHQDTHAGMAAYNNYVCVLGELP